MLQYCDSTCYDIIQTINYVVVRLPCNCCKLNPTLVYPKKCYFSLSHDMLSVGYSQECFLTVVLADKFYTLGNSTSLPHFGIIAS